MFRDWNKKKLKKEKSIQSVKKQLDSLEPSILVEIIKTNFKIELIQNENHNNPRENYEEIISNLINGEFWEAENPKLKKITDGELGKKTLNIWKLLKPYYRESYLKPVGFDEIWINLSKEIRKDLVENNDVYEIISSPIWSMGNNEILDPKEKSIKLKTLNKKEGNNYKIESDKELINQIRSYIGSVRVVSLEEYYEEVVEKLSPKQLYGFAKGKDKLEQILFLYIIKRAQNQDNIAANLLYESYKEKARSEAFKFIKNIENDIGLGFKPNSDFGRENISYVSDIFLRILISGDDPDSLFELINSLDDTKNLYYLFTRKLGKKIKVQIKQTKNQIDDTVNKIKNLYKEIDLIEKNSSIIMRDISETDFRSVNEKINKSVAEIEKPHYKSSVSYRKFIDKEKFSKNLNDLYSLYIKSEDSNLECQSRGIPDIYYSPEFECFGKEIKDDLSGILKIAKNKERQIINNLPNAYRSFVTTENMNDNERKIYQIFIEVDNLIKQHFFPKLDSSFLLLIGLSNPFFWVNTGDWFNNKLFDAKKNKNFSNWLFVDSNNKPGALKAMMKLWTDSSEFKSDGKFKGELFDDIEKKYNYIKNNSNEPQSFLNASNIATNSNSSADEVQDEINNLISMYVNQTPKTKRKRNSEILHLCLKRKMDNDKIKYSDLGKMFHLSKRQIINICGEFNIFAKKFIKSKK